MNSNQSNNWPLKGIVEIGSNDVIYGRGGKSTHHEGNKRFRTIVQGKKKEYNELQFLEKSPFALNLVQDFWNLTSRHKLGMM